MALSANTLSLMNYGLQITILNQNIDFIAQMGGPTLTAVIPLGFYSGNGLAQVIVNAMQSIDPVNGYTANISYNYVGGTQNRFTIGTDGTFLTLLFGTGPNVVTSIGPALGYNFADYMGSTNYTSSGSTGTNLIPEYVAYNYLDDQNIGKVFGAVNVSASGLKEAVVFNIQQFIMLEFMHEHKSRLPQWQAFFFWAIQQRPFDFIPEISNPTHNYQVTLDKSEYDGQGLGFQMKEELPNFPNLYGTGAMTYRIIAANQAFITGT